MLCGCSSSVQTKTVLIVPPEVFLQEIPAPAADRVKTNADLVDLVLEMRGVIASHNADKKALRAWVEGQTKP